MLKDNKMLMQYAREWIIDCHPDEEDDIIESSNDRIIKYISKNWGGGVDQFIKDMQLV